MSKNYEITRIKINIKKLRKIQKDLLSSRNGLARRIGVSVYTLNDVYKRGDCGILTAKAFLDFLEKNSGK